MSRRSRTVLWFVALPGIAAAASAFLITRAAPEKSVVLQSTIQSRAVSMGRATSDQLGRPTLTEQTEDKRLAGIRPPSATGLTAAELGLAREAEVATLTGGKIVRQEITVANVGRSQIDVIGRAGEYIQVGGPGKMAANLGEFGKHLSILRKKAEQDGVKTVACFAEGTPEAVLNVARRRLGAEKCSYFQGCKIMSGRFAYLYGPLRRLICGAC